MKKRSLLALMLVLAMCLMCLTSCGGGAEPTQAPSTQAPSTPAPTPAPTPEPEPTPEPTPEVDIGLVDLSIPEGTTLGSRMADFSFTTYDGNTYSLYETLAEKKAVLVNIWATWCGPCQMEFPFMEEAYEMLSDDIEVFAMSCEEEDDDETLAQFTEAFGMTFPTGADSAGINELFQVTSIPTSILVDRYGVICFIEAGSQTSVDRFLTLFDQVLPEEYPESVLLTDGIPKALPSVEPQEDAAISEALIAEGQSITVTNSDDEYDWPFVVQTEGDRTYLESSNAGHDETAAAVYATLTAAEGDYLALDYKVSSEAGYDFMVLNVDGAPVKLFSGERDWGTYATPLEAGEHEICLTFEKDQMTGEGEDKACVDNLRLVSGADAEAILAQMPQYPVAEETSVTALGDAKEIVMKDPDSYIPDAFGAEIAKYYILNSTEATFEIKLDSSIDPESTLVYSNFSGDDVLLNTMVDGDHYTFTTEADSVETTGYSYCYIEVSDPVSGFDGIYMFFASEENANSFLLNFTDEDGTQYVTWEYADGTQPSTDAVAEASDEPELPEGYSLYTLTFVDEEGNPVEGVIANVCDDTACEPMTSDVNGVVQFVKPSFAYHIQVIKVPDGYEYDTSEEQYLNEEGDDVAFVLTTAAAAAEE